jgi:hypothetical protein
MKLVSFLLPTPMGPQIRTGAIDAAGGIVDLAGAFRALLIAEGLPQGAAVRISEALLPGEMVALIEGGERSLDAARRAMQWAADEGPDGGAYRSSIREGFNSSPVRPPLLRDFRFETHLRIYRSWGEIRQAIDSGVKGQSSAWDARRRHAIPLRHGARHRVQRPWWERGGINIPSERALDHIFGYMIYRGPAIDSGREMSVGLSQRGKTSCAAT